MQNQPPRGFQFINGMWVIPKSLQSNLDYGMKMKYWLTGDDTLPANPLPVWELSANLQKVNEGIITDPTWGPIAFIKLTSVGASLGAYEWARCTWTTTQQRVEVQTLNFLMVQK